MSFSLAPPQSVAEFLSVLLVYVGSALLVACGCYFHAVRQETKGLVLLMIGGSILTLMVFTLTFGGAFYFYGLWGGVLSLAPSTMAILTMIAALLSRKSTVTN